MLPSYASTRLNLSARLSFRLPKHVRTACRPVIVAVRLRIGDGAYPLPEKTASPARNDHTNQAGIKTADGGLRQWIRRRKHIEHGRAGARGIAVVIGT